MRKLIFSCFILFSLTLYAQKPTVKIGLLVDMQSAAGDSLLAVLQAETQAVVGEDATVVFPKEHVLSNSYDTVLAKKQYNQLVASDVDMIIALGAISDLMLQHEKELPKPTILYGTLDKDLHNWDSLGNLAGRKNLTIVVEPASYRNDLKAFHELTEFNQVGIVVEEQLASILPYDETFKSIVDSLGADYKLIPFNTATDILNQLDGVDAIYLIGGYFFNDSEVEQLASAFIAKQIPSFTMNHPSQIQKGILAGSQSEGNLEQIIRNVALAIDQYIFMGTTNLGVSSIEYKPQLTINKRTAKRLGLPVKNSLLVDYDFIGALDLTPTDKPYALKELLAIALDQNLNVQSSQKQVEISQKDYALSKSNYLPSLTANGAAAFTDPEIAELSFGQNPEFQTSGNVSFNQLVFSEAANANMAIQKNLQKAQEEGLSAERLNTVFEVANLYFNNLVLKATAQINIHNLELIKQNHKIAVQNYETGQSSKSDVLRLKSQIAQSKQAVIESLNQVDQVSVQLNQSLNRSLSDKIYVEDAALDEGIFSELQYNQFIQTIDDPIAREQLIAFLIDEAKRNSPELKGIAYRGNAVNRGIKQNGFNRVLPTVQIVGQYTSVLDREGKGSSAPQGLSLPDNFYTANVNLSIPIFNRNQTNLNHQRFKIQQDQLNIEKDAFELGIEANIRNSIFNISNQISNIKLSKVSEETAEEALDISRDLYANGVVNIVQLIDAQNNYQNAQLASATAVYGYLIGMLQLERFIGYYFLLNTAEANAAFTQRYLEFINNI